MAFSIVEFANIVVCVDLLWSYVCPTQFVLRA
jgi:hypothetical protein